MITLGQWLSEGASFETLIGELLNVGVPVFIALWCANWIYKILVSNTNGGK